MMGFEAVLLLLFVGTAALLLLGFWILSLIMRPDEEPSGVDPILGARDCVAIYQAGAPFIRPHRDVFLPMPDHLATQEEIVSRMARELSKAMESAARPPD